jgi:hypothetical protein
LNRFPGQRVAKQILSTVWANTGRVDVLQNDLRLGPLYLFSPSAYRVKKSVLQLACDLLVKPLSDSSLLQKNTESATASTEHKNRYNQQTVHCQKLKRKMRRVAKQISTARFALSPP